MNLHVVFVPSFPLERLQFVCSSRPMRESYDRLSADHRGGTSAGMIYSRSTNHVDFALHADATMNFHIILTFPLERRKQSSSYARVL